MKLYFKKHAWGNTELRDLIDVMVETLGESGKEHPALDISRFQKDWLESAGTNCVRASWSKDSTEVLFT